MRIFLLSKLIKSKEALSVLLGAGLTICNPFYVHSQTQEKQIVSSKEVVISEIVSDEAAFSVIGASVVEEKTSNGTITDIDGNFSLMVSMGAAVKNNISTKYSLWLYSKRGSVK